MAISPRRADLIPDCHYDARLGLLGLNVSGYHFGLPDGDAGEILRNYLIPNFKEGQYGRGIIEGITEARKVMEKNRRLMYPEKYGATKNI